MVNMKKVLAALLEAETKESKTKEPQTKEPQTKVAEKTKKRQAATIDKEDSVSQKRKRRRRPRSQTV